MHQCNLYEAVPVWLWWQWAEVRLVPATRTRPRWMCLKIQCYLGHRHHSFRYFRYKMQLSGAGQAVVTMGEVGVTASDPDMAALDVLGDVLNSFGGRLFDRIRSREVQPLYV